MNRQGWAPRSKPSVPGSFDPLDEAKTLDVAREGADLKVTCRAPRRRCRRESCACCQRPPDRRTPDARCHAS
ncbi:hypothetical protein [Corallococcus exiguus]|uniref:Uncharacterized protein n=1 Tax=Corallococcus exiguus TaxID=83462 RepID=A0A7X5BX34_9BACT|nr:hypothetical protein [Corallococcus exiguus]NBC44818.1 hypothetical protein [Corallococcus exiguus]TNV66191.1 hypothetical protein FH620_07480 [Corallococcus exiguus]